MASSIVNDAVHKTLWFSAKLRPFVYYCDVCIKVQSLPYHVRVNYLYKVKKSRYTELLIDLGEVL